MEKKNDKYFEDLLHAFLEDLNQIEDFQDKLYTLLAFLYVLEQKAEDMYGKIEIPLAGGFTRDPCIKKRTIKFESHFKHLLQKFDPF